jgi:general secretion pathway protein A
MDANYRHFFELTREPFTNPGNRSEILVTQAVTGVEERIRYAVRLGAICVVTGEIGSGKSTALGYVALSFHPSEYRVANVTASSGTIMELYRQIAAALGIARVSSSRATMIALIKNEITDLVCDKKKKVVLFIDEASLLRLEVFAELHTLTQFDHDSKPWLPLVLAGQSNLADNLRYRGSMPLASRVVARTHIKGVDREGMQQYLLHHLALAGRKNNLFDEAAITAIHQGAGGLFRKANHLARGAIIAAGKEKVHTVTAEHVRLAATELY